MTEPFRKEKPVKSLEAVHENLEEILRESSRLMATNGFHGTSMRDLARETGRSLSGLYHYFQNKEDLLYLINSVGFSALLRTWQNLEPEFSQPAEKLYALVFSHTAYYVDHMHEMRVMTWGTQPLTPEKATRIKELKELYLKACIKVLRALKSRDDASISEKSLERQAYLLFGMMNWLFAWYEPQKHGSSQDLARDIFRTFLVGFCGSITDFNFDECQTKLSTLQSTSPNSNATDSFSNLRKAG